MASSKGPRVSLDALTVALLISAILYVFCLVLAQRKLSFLNRISPDLNTKKLLVLSVGLVSLLRIMSFVGVAALNTANIRAHYSMQPSYGGGGNNGSDVQGGGGGDANTVQDQNQVFYDGAMTVLFDLPNTIVVSTYVLLTLVWAECFLQSRFHTENTRKFQRRWLGGYTIFNACLYGTQTILYILIFALSSKSTVRAVLYAALTAVNFTAVVLVLVLYIYLSLQFSGYPFRSEYLKRSFGKIASLMGLWSLARILWGVASLLVYIYNVELLQDSNTTPFWSFFLLFLLFIVCEIIPIVAMLDYSYMNIIGFETSASNDMTMLASGQSRNNNHHAVVASSSGVIGAEAAPSAAAGGRGTTTMDARTTGDGTTRLLMGREGPQPPPQPFRSIDESVLTSTNLTTPSLGVGSSGKTRRGKRTTSRAMMARMTTNANNTAGSSSNNSRREEEQLPQQQQSNNGKTVRFQVDLPDAVVGHDDDHPLSSNLQDDGSSSGRAAGTSSSAGPSHPLLKDYT